MFGDDEIAVRDRRGDDAALAMCLRLHESPANCDTTSLNRDAQRAFARADRRFQRGQPHQHGSGSFSPSRNDSFQASLKNFARPEIRREAVIWMRSMIPPEQRVEPRFTGKWRKPLSGFQ